MFDCLPPVGNRIYLGSSTSSVQSLQSAFAPYRFYFYGSGTMALAAALIAARKMKVKQMEVIVPAYACPDLISAIRYAGAIPVLVDMEPERPWLNLRELSAKINNKTLAVIAVHLFGIPERVVEIARLTRDAGILFIEDRAQSAPGDKARLDWEGDIVVYSFGRGKPVTLLEGGAVIIKDDRLADLLPMSKQWTGLITRRLSPAYLLKALVYNTLISPRLYWLTAAMPFLHLGETHYRTLRELKPAKPGLIPLLAANIECYWRRNQTAQEWIAAMVKRLGALKLVDLQAICVDQPMPRLLRYPLLATSSEYRERLYSALNRAQLGVSKMYPAPLPRINGLEKQLRDQGDFPAAEDFARRLLTLPVHAGVRKKHVLAMERIFEDIPVVGH